MKTNARSYYNALLAAGRVRELTLDEAQRDLDQAVRPVAFAPLYHF